jgi:hypothetical protein
MEGRGDGKMTGREKKMMDGSRIQLHARLCENVSNSIDPSLGFGPIRRINGVSNSREIGLIVAGPCLWCKNDVFKLCPVGDLVGRSQHIKLLIPLA